MNVRRCRHGCGAQVEIVQVWFLDKVKRRGEPTTWMPVDLTKHDPDDVKAHIAVSGSTHRRGRVLKDGEDLLDGEERRMTHFATCTVLQRQRAQAAALKAAEATGADNVVPFRPASTTQRTTSRTRSIR